MALTEGKDDVSVSYKDVIKFRMFRGDNSGNYGWKIRDKQLVQNILNAKNGDIFETKPFMMANLQWVLRLYPNGDKEAHKGNIQILLKLVTMPPTLNNITTAFTIFLPQTMTFWTDITNMTKNGGAAGFPPRKLFLSTWKQMEIQEITIITSVKIQKLQLKKNSDYLSLCNVSNVTLKTINYTNKIKFVDKITNNDVMNMIKKSWPGRLIESELLDNIWKLQYYPNGVQPSLKGWFGVCLRLCYIPPYIKAIKVRYTVKCLGLFYIFNGSFSSNIVFVYG